MIATTYYLGGFLPTAAAQNRAGELDSVAATATTWDEAGIQTSQRALTDAEVADFAAQDAAALADTNDDGLRGKLNTALTANAAFLAVLSPTAAQLLAQVQRLTREVSALGRLALGALDDVSGT